MTHLPYIVGSYAAFAIVAAAMTLSGAVRLRGAARRLAALDTRRNRGGGA